MLGRIRLKRFQCHKYLELNLGRITTLVGPSDSGKSSVVRALKFLCLNDIRGDNFITRGEESCEVGLEVDGKSVTRHKKGSVNRYVLDSREFTAFGNSVPDALTSLLAVNGVNFQKQLDGHFWLTETSGKVSRSLNESVDLALIDSVSSCISQRQRLASAKKSSLSEQLEEAAAVEQSYCWASELDRRVTEAERLSESINRRRTRLASIEALYTQALSSQGTIVPSDPYELQVSLTALQARRRKLMHIKQMVSMIRDSQERLCHAESILSDLNEQTQSLRTSPCPLCGQTPS